VPLGGTVLEEQPDRERAFLVGLDVRSRRGKGAVPAQAAAAREVAAMTAEPEIPPSLSSGQVLSQKTRRDGAHTSNGKPNIPDFDADESLAELRTLA